MPGDMSGKCFYDNNHIATDWCRKNRLWRAFSRISSAGAEHPRQCVTTAIKDFAKYIIKNRNIIFEHEFLIFSAELKLTFLKLYHIQRFWTNRISLEERSN